MNPKTKQKLFDSICVVSGATVGMLVGFALAGIKIAVSVALFTTILFTWYVH